MTSRSRSRLDLWKIVHSFRNEFFTCLFKVQNVQVIQNDVIKCCKMMSSNVALLHSNNCCVLEPAICEDLDLHVVIYFNFWWSFWCLCFVDSLTCMVWSVCDTSQYDNCRPFSDQHGSMIPFTYLLFQAGIRGLAYESLLLARGLTDWAVGTIFED